MKKAFLFLVLATTLAACTKKTTNNYVVWQTKPPYSVNGIHDMTITNGDMAAAVLALSIEYYDSTQEKVTLAISGLPNGITINDDWIKVGIPSFTSTLIFSDTTTGVTPGDYTVTITATSATFGTKSLPFDLKVVNPALCTNGVVHNYTTGTSSCYTGAYFTDFVDNDPVVSNKIWVHNFKNAGIALYAWYDCTSGSLIFPTQVVGGNTYYGNGNYNNSSHSVFALIYSGGSDCSINLNY